MDEDRLTRAESIFQAAADLSSAERSAFVNASCGGDADLRALVERLLARHHDGMGSFLEPNSPARIETEGKERPSSGFERIGPFVLRERIGVGGMGEVWRAEQTSPVRRTVAIKLIKAGMDSAQVLTRFEAERQALALMDHPNVCRVFDAGETKDGRPYFVMELLHGEPLVAYCDRERLSLHERLELFLTVCSAIQHAHQKGVIHRDVKPSNVLVTVIDGARVPKVIDFGIAKATASALTEKTLFTAQGQVVGTPAYMSPEQAEGSGIHVDTRTDVYSLGVLLYELLTGQLPFDASALREAGLDGMRRIIREGEPRTPSARVYTLGAEAQQAAERRGTDPARWRKALRQELDWIVMKALEKDRQRRYQSAGELAADLQRYLVDQPVLAGPPDTLYRFRKYLKRHHVAAGFVGVAAAGVVLSLVLASAENARTKVARAEAEAVTSTLEEMLASVEPTKGRGDVSLRDVLDETAATMGDRFAGQPRIESRLRLTVGRTYLALGRYSSAEEHLRRATVIRERLFGAEDVGTLEAKLELARALRQEAKYEEAGELARETLAARRLTLGERHPLTLAAMQELARISWIKGRYATYWTTSRFEDAEALLKETLEASRDVLGDEHPETLEAMAGLAFTHALQGHFEEAETETRQVLKLQRRVLGVEHPQTLSSQANLGVILRQVDRRDEACGILQETLLAQRRILGEEHPDTILTMRDLAIIYTDQDRFEEATSLQRETLDLSRRVFGEDHPHTLRVLEDLADTCGLHGNRREAERLRREILEVTRRVAGEDDLQTRVAMNNLAMCLCYQGRYDEAEALYGKLLEISLRLNGEENSGTIWCMERLVYIRAAQGRHDEARALARKALGIARASFGIDHKRSIGTLCALAYTYMDEKRYEDAEPLFRECLAIARRVFSGSDAYIVEPLEHLARCCEELDRPDEAEAFLRELLDIRVRNQGREHGLTIEVMNMLASFLARQERHEDAQALRSQALDLSREVLGDEHPTTNAIRYGAACELALQHRWQESAALLRTAIERGFRGPDFRLGDPSDLRGPRRSVLESILDEPAFSSMQGTPEFEAIVAELKRRDPSDT